MTEPKSSLPTDPLEKKVAEALRAAGVSFYLERDIRNPTWLDFYIPDWSVAIEVKQFHSERIGNQMLGTKNVIVLQGSASVDFFCSVLNGASSP